MGLGRTLGSVVMSVCAVCLISACIREEPPESIVPSLPSATPALEHSLSGAQDAMADRRRVMVDSQIKSRGVKDKVVLGAMGTVAREQFVLPEYLDQAYADHPLPIGHGQTISQPYIVAAMTEVLHLNRDSRVLEVGTGSGYQAAILATIVSQVYTVEIVEPLYQSAVARLEHLGYDNVQVRLADGYHGWKEHEPYDAIIVTCAPDHIPQPLVSQLADGGRMVIPVGPPGAYQVLWLVERVGEETHTERLMGVSFVPLTGEH